MINNVNIYEIIGYDADPLYHKLNSLDPLQEIMVDGYVIRWTGSLYEVVSEEIHEGFRELIKCYEFLDLLLASTN